MFGCRVRRRGIRRVADHPARIPRAHRSPAG